MVDRYRALAAEALGSAILFATVIGSGIMASALAQGNDAVALLGNTLATAAMLFVLITTLGPVSGAHFNPAVSLVMALRGSLPMRDSVFYVAAQSLGGLAGVVLAHAMYNQPLLQVSGKIRGTPGEWLGEAVATFMLIFTILGSERHRPAYTAISVAAVITAGYWFTSSTSFANPAITLARSLTDSFAGIAPASVLAFIIAQCVGAVAALFIARWIFTPVASPGST
jgi:glycerol uptake facilitator-like aquaporin